MRITILAVACASLGLAACSPQPKEYDYPSWGFAASFLAKPNETDKPPDAQHGAVKTVEATVDGRDFTVVATDVSQMDSTPDQEIDQMLNAAASDAGVQIMSRTAFSLAGSSGTEATMNKDGKPWMLLRFVVIGGKLYSYGGSSTNGLDDPALKQFLDSFHIIPIPQSTS